MRKSLPKAIALATMLGAAASAHAVNINPDGLGEVLLYPIYTTEAGNNTNIRITNTTDHAKAVKVRFVEGQNSQEVLDFNLYLSPRDQWSGAITQTANGAMLVTSDKSCTAPMIPADGVKFRDLEYLEDGGEQSLARTRVGHVEIIEMGVLEENLAKLVTADHNVAGSAPANCAGIIAKFEDPADPWYDTNVGLPRTGDEDLQDGIVTHVDNVRVTGGLYGSANIINLDGATQVAYDAVAIDNFLDESVHVVPGSNAPDLDSGNIASVAVFKDGTTANFNGSANAVSALLMKESINNDFFIDERYGAETSWVVTFPTKKFHVNTTPATNPFVNAWNSTGNGTACHTIDLAVWDHEEYDPVVTPEKGGIDFSPRPPVVDKEPVTWDLCYETNVISFNEKNVLGGEHVPASITLPEEYGQGWMQLSFIADKHNNTTTSYTLESEDDKVVHGLPAIGFAATVLRRDTANAQGAFNNYGSAIEHKSSTRVTDGTAP